MCVVFFKMDFGGGERDPLGLGDWFSEGEAER